MVLVVNILKVAGLMNVKTCVEGVETKGIVDFLRPENAAYYQGYYYSKPMPMDEYEKYLEKFDLKH